MLDIKYIRENKEKVIKGILDKGFNVDIDRLLLLDEEIRKLKQEEQNLRAQRNLQSKNKPTQEEIEKLRQVGDKVRDLDEKEKILFVEYEKILLSVPNPPLDVVPVGKDDSANQVIKIWGTPVKFAFPPKDHVDLGLMHDLIDIERGTKIAQSGFYYLKNEGALLELALINYVLGKLVKKGFIPVFTPELAKEKIIAGTGYKARSEKERQIYKIEGEDLHLIATAEITLIGQHADEILDNKNLPLKYAGFSSCFRVEAGSYGKDVRGILRVHQFDKVEMVVFCKPEDAHVLHEEFLAIEEEIYQELEIPYQVILIGSGDLGSAAAKKYDVEAWIPSQNKYREVTSTSNTTDFQTRRLNIKYREDNAAKYLYTLNGTACAIGRTIIAILENYQQEDGSIKIPDVLKSYIGKEYINGNSNQNK